MKENKVRKEHSFTIFNHEKIITYSDGFSIIFTSVAIPFLLMNSFANEGSSAWPAPSLPANRTNAVRFLPRSGCSISDKYLAAASSYWLDLNQVLKCILLSKTCSLINKFFPK